jgi:hypothetical protein
MILGSGVVRQGFARALWANRDAIKVGAMIGTQSRKGRYFNERTGG